MAVPGSFRIKDRTAWRAGRSAADPRAGAGASAPSAGASTHQRRPPVATASGDHEVPSAAAASARANPSGPGGSVAPPGEAHTARHDHERAAAWYVWTLRVARTRWLAWWLGLLVAVVLFLGPGGDVALLWLVVWLFVRTIPRWLPFVFRAQARRLEARRSIGAHARRVPPTAA